MWRGRWPAPRSPFGSLFIGVIVVGLLCCSYSYNFTATGCLFGIPRRAQGVSLCYVANHTMCRDTHTHAYMLPPPCAFAWHSCASDTHAATHPLWVVAYGVSAFWKCIRCDFSCRQWTRWLMSHCYTALIACPSLAVGVCAFLACPCTCGRCVCALAYQGTAIGARHREIAVLQW